MEKCDFFHPDNIFPRTLKSTKSNFGIIITFAFIGYTIYYIWFEEINKYYLKYTVSYKHDFLKISNDKNQKISFGLKIDKSWAKNIELEFINQNNNIISKNLIKICDENLIELKNNEINENNYSCILNYALKGSHISNHIIKVHLKYNDKYKIHKIKQIEFHYI